MTEETVRRYAYYPGCSLLAGAKEYDLSVRAVFAFLGIELVELEDWNCCGAVHASVNKAEAGLALSARNLALAEAQGFDTILSPCSGCYNNLRSASKRIADDPSLRTVMKEHLNPDFAFQRDITVLHPLYVLLAEEILERVKNLIAVPLGDLRIASYYGCMLTRPKDIFDSPERPQGLDDLALALGAQVVDYAMKAKCCGGALLLSHGGVTAKLTGSVLTAAKAAGADVVMLACPLCHASLDSYQSQAERAVGSRLELPILYFTQAMGLAFGLEPEALGLHRHLVSPQAELARLFQKDMP